MQMTYLDQNGNRIIRSWVATALGSGGWLPRYAKHITTTTALSGLSPSLPGRCICAAVRADDPAVRACADQLYEDLQGKGIEVIYDDRNISAGVMFSDADLLGVPIRVIVSPRNLRENCCEIVTRDKSICQKVPVADTVARSAALTESLLARSWQSAEEK